MKFLEFMDKLIPYDTFLNDFAARIVKMLENDRDAPEYISQRTAYKMFGRRNVERWRKQGLVVPCKRPRRVEYRTADLRMLQRTVQDYFIHKPPEKDM